MTSFSFAYNRFTKDIWYDPPTFADCACVTTGDEPVTPNAMFCGRCVASALIVTRVSTHARNATNNSGATILAQPAARGVRVFGSERVADGGCRSTAGAVAESGAWLMPVSNSRSTKPARVRSWPLVVSDADPAHALVGQCGPGPVHDRFGTVLVRG